MRPPLPLQGDRRERSLEGGSLVEALHGRGRGESDGSSEQDGGWDESEHHSDLLFADFVARRDETRKR
jgi:hypothetical protein